MWDSEKNAWCILQHILEVGGNSTYNHDHREILQIHFRCLGKSYLWTCSQTEGVKKELCDICRSLLQLRFMTNGRNFLSVIMTETADAFGAPGKSGYASGATTEIHTIDYGPARARSPVEINYSVSLSIRISRCCDDRSRGRARIDGLAFFPWQEWGSFPAVELWLSLVWLLTAYSF